MRVQVAPGCPAYFAGRPGAVICPSFPGLCLKDRTDGGGMLQFVPSAVRRRDRATSLPCRILTKILIGLKIRNVLMCVYVCFIL